MVSKEGFIGGPTGGVPKEIFVPGFHDEIEGKSGTKLTCLVKPYRIWVSGRNPGDTGERDFFSFSAVRHENNVVKFNIKAKKGNPPTRHPDIYAAELFKHAIAFFDEQEPSITTIRAEWRGYEDSDNYKQYMENLRALTENRSPTQPDMKEAARHTWTGKLATISLGFTEIDRVFHTRFASSEGSARTAFSKPQSNQE